MLGTPGHRRPLSQRAQPRGREPRAGGAPNLQGGGMLEAGEQGSDGAGGGRWGRGCGLPGGPQSVPGGAVPPAEPRPAGEPNQLIKLRAT